MKRFFNIAIIAISICFMLVGCKNNSNLNEVKTESTIVGNTNENTKLNIYTSFYPMYDFTLRIGGDKVTVTNLVPAGTEPHDWEPSTTDIIALEKADILIYNGVDMEHWVDKIVDSLNNKDIILVETSIGIDLLEGDHGHDDEEEDEHEDEEEDEDDSYDPHVWISIKNAKVQLNNIKEALMKADPENADYFNANFETHVKKFDDLDKKFEDSLSGLENRDIIVAHKAFSYLCADYGLNQVAIEGLAADSEPDAKRMTEIIEFAKEHQIKTIFFEELVSPKVAETIAAEIGANTDVLNPIEGLTKEQLDAGEDYLSIMEKNLEALLKALSK